MEKMWDNLLADTLATLARMYAEHKTDIEKLQALPLLDDSPIKYVEKSAPFLGDLATFASKAKSKVAYMEDCVQIKLPRQEILQQCVKYQQTYLLAQYTVVVSAIIVTQQQKQSDDNSLAGLLNSLTQYRGMANF